MIKTIITTLLLLSAILILMTNCTTSGQADSKPPLNYRFEVLGKYEMFEGNRRIIRLLKDKYNGECFLYTPYYDVLTKQKCPTTNEVNQP